jgi:hypothetical protein
MINNSCNDYEVGRMGPFNKVVKEIIAQSDNYIVFMDADDTIQWATSGLDGLPEGYGEINNKISDWEIKTNRLFGKKEAYDYKTILAEGYARLFSEKNIELARDVIDRAGNTIVTTGSEVLKKYYSFSATIATILAIVIIFVTKYYKQTVIETFGRDEYNIWMTMLFGGIGAYIFTTIRSRDYKPDIVVSKWIHALDGALRIFYGMIAGLIIVIAIKSNLVLGFLNQIEKSIYVLVFVGICAGASDLIIPNIIKQMEKKSISENEKKSPGIIKNSR